MFCISWYTLVYYGILWFSQNRPNTLYQLARGFCAVQPSFTAAVGKLRNLLKQDSLPAKVKPLGLQEADHNSLYLKKKNLMVTFLQCWCTWLRLSHFQGSIVFHCANIPSHLIQPVSCVGH